MPVVKLQTGKYIIGTHCREIIIKQTNLLFRVGGGYLDLKSFILKEAKIECIKILQDMVDENTTFCDVMCKVLLDNGATEKVMQKFRESNSKLDEPFHAIVSAIK